ncbi:MAG: hypothetical protein ABR508_05680 [Candidatus Baltobacteraceae bacterium]
MKPSEPDDELERALFALDLEEPPTDLRANILACTIYRAPITIRAWEVSFAGALCAVIAWLVIVAAQGGVPGVQSAAPLVSYAFTSLARLDVLFWIAVGASAAFWISQLNLMIVPGASRTVRR